MAATRKPKTHKGMAKRIKVTGGGKLVRRRGGASHLLSSKTGKRRRHLRQSATVPDHIAKSLKPRLSS